MKNRSDSDKETIAEQVKNSLGQKLTEIEDSIAPNDLPDSNLIQSYIKLLKDFTIHSAEVLVNDLSKYVEVKLNSLIDQLTGQLANLLSSVLKVFLLLIFGIIALFFLSVALAVWVGELMQHRALGYVLVALLYILLGIGLYQFGSGWIQRFLKSLFDKKMKTEK